ncbi:hypothetical protein ACHAXT_004695 [Thalassiosira profunda]
MTPVGPFRKCHLQILRSLYDGASAPDRGSEGEEPEPSGGDNEDANARCTGDGDGDNLEETGAPAGGEGDASTEGPVDGETWDLIAQFLWRRAEYRPHRDRQVHWANVSAAAQSRLDRLLSVTSADMDARTIAQRTSSLTPRTPSVFSAAGRGARSPAMSLTPLSSNKKRAPKLTQGEREAASALPSWTFIHNMLQRRSKICTQSCEDYRSQPFLTELREEAEMRCTALGKVLMQLQTGGGAQRRNEKKREGDAFLEVAGKRQKVIAVQPTVPSSLGQHLPSRTISAPGAAALDSNEGSGDSEDLIMETQMKLCLWSSLLSSVKEVVEEK